jgi:hypothetical protein
VILILPFYILSKKLMAKVLKEKYENSLLEGDEENAKRNGRLYYHLLSQQKIQERNIVEIDNKINEEFNSFNHIR